MPTIFKLNSRTFNQSIEDYVEFFKKDLVNECNRRAANVCARAITHTKRANINQIVKDMKAIETVKASYIKETKRRGQYVALSKGGKTTQGERTVGYMGKPEAFAIANWRLKRGKSKGFYKKFPNKFAGPGRGKSGGTASEYFDRFVARARSSSGYVASGWIKAYNLFKAIAMGKTIKLPPDMKFFKAPTGSASRSNSIPAVFGGDRVRAVFFNTADGVEKIGTEALEKAIKEEERDIIEYMNSKMQKDFNKIKG